MCVDYTKLKVFFFVFWTAYLKGSWKYDAANKLVKISLQQTQPEAYHFDASIEVGIYKTGELLPSISVHSLSSRTIEISIPADAKPEKVLLDPQTILLASWDFEEVKPLTNTKK